MPDVGGTMFEIIFAIAVAVVILFGNLAKAAKKKPSAAPWARVQNGAQRLQAWATPQPMPPPMQPGPIAPIQPYTFPTPQQYPAPPLPAGQLYFQTGPLQYQPAPIRVPSSQQDLDTRVRKLMEAGHEVGAVRLLCDEADLGIIEAQRYARSLAGLDAGTGTAAPAERRTTEGRDVDAEPRDIGSAAFATSTFDLGEDEGWASGWTDKPEADDRTDMDELWRTVREAGQPRSAATSADNSVFESEIDLD